MTTALDEIRTPLDDAAIPDDERHPGWPKPLLDDLAWLRTGIVNVVFSGKAGAKDRSWALVDAGLGPWTGAILAAAAKRYGPESRPEAIILTHGHFDHVGALQSLAATWDVPVYAHPLELPYIRGVAAYPPPDPTVGGGAMASLSWLYPRGPIDLGERARALPEDGAVPGMPGWRWVATPGHSPGHVSLFREGDRALIAGDAFVTVPQESALAALAQRPVELHGPPKYFTCDWESSRRSVEALAALHPELAVTGHGPPLRGPELRDALDELARDFRARAVPPRGRYVGAPATADVHGPRSIPPADWDVPAGLAKGLALGAGVGLVLAALLPKRR